MARKYEGSAEDEAEDRRGAKATGMSPKAYENSARDRAEDAAGERRVKVGPHHRKPPKRRAPPPAPPMPGPHVFDADQEQAMRAQNRASNAGGPDLDGEME